MGLRGKGEDGKDGGEIFKWVLGMDRRTREYLVREKLQRDKLRERAGRRAWGYERRLQEGKGSELARSC